MIAQALQQAWEGLNFDQRWHLIDLVEEKEFNPNHPDDTFNAGWGSCFETYTEAEQWDLMKQAQAFGQ